MQSLSEMLMLATPELATEKLLGLLVKPAGSGLHAAKVLLDTKPPIPFDKTHIKEQLLDDWTAPKGTLGVHVVEAKGLIAVDTRTFRKGTSDPYVKVGTALRAWVVGPAR